MENPVAVVVIRTVCVAPTQEGVTVIVEKTSASEVDAWIAVPVPDTVRALTRAVAPDSQEKALSATGCLLCNSVYWLM